MTLNQIAAWFHRRLLRFYPAEFREEFGAEMEQDLRARMARRGVARVWAETLLDWLTSAPREQLDVTRRDLRVSVRALARSPLFTTVVVLSLAIGIGAASVVFTIANSLLIQTPLDKDLSTFAGVVRGDGSSEPSSWPDYVDYRDRNRSFSQLAAWTVTPVFLGRGRESRSVMAETVTDNYFQMIGVQPYLGRLFQPGDCRPACTPQVVLSHRFWQGVYAGDRGIVGRAVTLGGVPATVIGVAPKGFDGTLAPVMTDIWTHVENRRTPEPALFSDRGTRWLAIAGRLAPGVSRTQAVAELNAIDRQLQREYRYSGTAQDRRLWVPSTRGIAVPVIRRRVEIIVGLLGAIALLVLAISCANVANMLLARATARRQETAIRRALGAGDSRVIRLSLTESLVLAALGGAAGGMLSTWATGLLSMLQPPANDLYTYHVVFRTDVRVWVFTVAASLLCGLLFGVLPAWQAARVDCLPAMRSQDAQGRPRRLAQRALVCGQVAFSVVLLVVAGLFSRSFATQQAIAPGFPTARNLIVPLNLTLQSYAGDEAKGRRFYDAVRERVRAVPGVESASLTSYVPLNAAVPDVSVTGDAGAPVRAALDVIDPDYLAAVNVPLVAGRGFSLDDRQGSAPVVLVDERLARALWPGEAAALEAVGRTVRVGEEKALARVVGVVASEFRRSLTEAPRPMLFLPVAQRYVSMLYLVVRTRTAPAELMEPVRRAVESIDDSVSLRRMRTFDAQVSDGLWPIRTGARAVSGASAVAVLLAVLGLYGVIAYSMARREREMAIRMALGAGTADVVRLVLRQGLAMTLWGVVIGVPLGAAANLVLAHTLYGLRRLDAAVLSAGIVIWVTIACVACVPPAWRAARNSIAAIRDAG